jgi:hypothetical protein
VGSAAPGYGWSLTATGVKPPVIYDNSSISAQQAALPSGTAFTWSLGVGSGSPYGIIAVYSETISGMDASATAVISLGGVALSSLGYVATSDSTGLLWLFGANSIPAGTQTASVKFTEAGNTFSGWAAAFTYKGVASVGALQTASGSSTTPSVSVPSAIGNMVWGGYFIHGTNAVSGFTLTPRQVTGDSFAVLGAGDAVGASSVTVGVTLSGAESWAVAGLNLIPI